MSGMAHILAALCVLPACKTAEIGPLDQNYTVLASDFDAASTEDRFVTDGSMPVPLMPTPNQADNPNASAVALSRPTLQWTPAMRNGTQLSVWHRLAVASGGAITFDQWAASAETLDGYCRTVSQETCNSVRSVVEIQTCEFSSELQRVVCEVDRPTNLNLVSDSNDLWIAGLTADFNWVTNPDITVNPEWVGPVTVSLQFATPGVAEVFDSNLGEGPQWKRKYAGQGGRRDVDPATWHRVYTRMTDENGEFVVDGSGNFIDTDQWIWAGDPALRCREQDGVQRICKMVSPPAGMPYAFWVRSWGPGGMGEWSEQGNARNLILSIDLSIDEQAAELASRRTGWCSSAINSVDIRIKEGRGVTITAQGPQGSTFSDGTFTWTAPRGANDDNAVRQHSVTFHASSGSATASKKITFRVQPRYDDAGQYTLAANGARLKYNVNDDDPWYRWWYPNSGRLTDWVEGTYHIAPNKYHNDELIDPLASATFRFTGSQVRLIGFKNQVQGLGRVVLRPVGKRPIFDDTVSWYNRIAAYGSVVFDSGPIPPGEYVMTVYFLGQKSPEDPYSDRDFGHAINIDALDVRID